MHLRCFPRGAQRYTIFVIAYPANSLTLTFATFLFSAVQLSAPTPSTHRLLEGPQESVAHVLLLFRNYTPRPSYEADSGLGVLWTDGASSWRSGDAAHRAPSRRPVVVLHLVRASFSPPCAGWSRRPSSQRLSTLRSKFDSDIVPRPAGAGSLSGMIVDPPHICPASSFRQSSPARMSPSTGRNTGPVGPTRFIGFV